MRQMTDTEIRESNETRPGVVLRTATDGRLHVTVAGRCVPVRLRQCFPWSEPGLHLSLRDDEDREVAIVDDPALLEPESRRALEQALAEAGVVVGGARGGNIAGGGGRPPGRG